MSDQIIVTERSIPTDRLLLEGIDVSKGPKFRVAQVGSLFFAKSPQWVRWKEKEEHFILDGENVGEPERVGGQRFYTLADIEKMAHALASNGAINARQLTDALLVVQSIGRVWGYVI